MTRKIIDLSICVENDIRSDPPGYEPHIDYIDHKASASDLMKFFPGLKAEIYPTKAKPGPLSGFV